MGKDTTAAFVAKKEAEAYKERLRADPAALKAALENLSTQYQETLIARRAAAGVVSTKGVRDAKARKDEKEILLRFGYHKKMLKAAFDKVLPFATENSIYNVRLVLEPIKAPPGYFVQSSQGTKY